MKKVQLIEWGIIVVGLVIGYKFFESVFLLFIQTIYSFDAQMAGSSGYILKSVLAIGIYGVSFVAVIRNSHPLASFLNGGAANDAIPLKIGKRSALQIVLIAICAMQLFSGIATILIYLYESFKSDVNQNRFNPAEFDSISKEAFRVAAVRCIVALVVICFSKDLTNLFFRKNEPDELVLESKPVEDNDNNNPVIS
jgi:hypothetical protein